MESLKDRNSTQGTTKNIPLAFFQEHTHPFIEIPAVAAIIHENLTLTIFFTSKESLPTGNLLRHTWNTHLKHLPNTGRVKLICVNFFVASPFKPLNCKSTLLSQFRSRINVFWHYIKNLPWNCLDARYDNKTNISKETLVY